MQAVVALCHFCENHGPRVVFTCQPLRDDQAQPSSSCCPSTSKAPNGPVQPIAMIRKNGELHNVTLGYNNRSMLALGNGVELWAKHYGNCTRTIMDTEDRCKACTSFGRGPCILSNDHDNKTSYVSSEAALHDRVHDIVKSACIRSLCSEVTAASRATRTTSSPSKSTRRGGSAAEGTSAVRIGTRSSTAILLKNQELQTVVENVVSESMPDAEEADGSVIFGDGDNGFCFAYIFRVADAKARGFHRLFSIVVVSNDLTFLTNNFEYYKRALREMKNDIQRRGQAVYEREIDQGEKLGDDDITKPEYASMVGKMPRWFRRKIAIDTDRNLETITNTPEIWRRLHRQMMWALRVPTVSTKDKVMEGKPSEDMMVLMEMNEEAVIELQLHHPNQHAVSMLQLANLKWISNHLNDSDNPDDLALLIRQVVTGGQIVVESVDKQLSKQVLLAIANMLPVGCCKMAGFRDAYRPEYSTSFNLMGGPINMDVPLEVSDVMILRITSNSGILHAETEDNFIIRDSFITVRRRPDKEDKEDIYAGNPAIVKRYRDLLLDTAVKDMVLETTMRTTRESWMQKAKLAYQMKGNARGLDILKNIIGCAIEDRQVVLFWQAGLSMAYKDHVHQAFETPRNSLSR